MKKLILAAALALTAAAQAEAAPIRPVPTQWYEGTWTCTIRNADNQKVFMTLGTISGRAAVRAYPYYGKAEYTQLHRAGGRFASVNFAGRGMFLALRRSATEGVMTGTARTTYRIMLLTCAKS